MPVHGIAVKVGAATPPAAHANQAAVAFVIENAPLPTEVLMMPDELNEVNVPTDVIAAWAAPVTVAAVPEQLPVTLPVKGPLKAVAENNPVDGLKFK